jgi:hypothetical protein
MRQSPTISAPTPEVTHRLFFPNGKIVHKTLQESLGAIEIVPCVIAPQIAGLECQAAVNLQFGSPHLV